jgi:hypothetical protein
VVDSVVRGWFGGGMRFETLLVFLSLASFCSVVSAESEKMSEERILRLWKLEDDRSAVPDGFQSWTNAREYKGHVTRLLPNGEKEVLPPVKCSEKIVLGKFIIYRVYPPDPIDIYGIYWYESATRIYRKTILIKGKAGTEAEGFARTYHLLGMQYPNTDIYAFTQIDSNKPEEKIFLIERQNKKSAEWKEIIYSKDGKSILRQFIGRAIPIKTIVEERKKN